MMAQFNAKELQMNQNNKNLPLSGIIVADFSHVMAGPYASYLLGLMGAEVIKIESPERGDAMRYYGNDRRYDGMAPAFIGVNAGKKSITLNLKNSDDLQTAKDIIKRSDVVLENFRPGVMERLGLGYYACCELKPDLVYCSVSGYGQSGARTNWPAIDNIVQATSGMMSLMGSQDDPPMRVGFPAVDTLTGQTAAFAILVALFRREKEGKGEYIDVAMFDATLSFMTSAVTPYLITGKTLERTGNVGYSGQPTSAMFTCLDGKQISMGVVQQNQFETLAKFLGHPEWVGNPKYLNSDLRVKNSDELTKEISDILNTRNSGDWEKEMSAIGIPCGVVRSVADATILDELDDRNIFIPVNLDCIPNDVEQPKVLGSGFVLKSQSDNSLAPPPKLGQHSDEIRHWLNSDK